MTFLSCAIWKRHEMTKCSQGKAARVNSQCKITWDAKRAGMAGSDQGQTALNKSKHIILQWGTAKSFSTARGDAGAGLDLRSAIPLGTKALQRSNNQMCPVFPQVHRIKNISNYISWGSNRWINGPSIVLHGEGHLASANQLDSYVLDRMVWNALAKRQ